jgi:lipid II:glycine glycyltransferase (peptidoglycan interpeptide bridge formation enzyme)
MVTDISNRNLLSVTPVQINPSNTLQDSSKASTEDDQKTSIVNKTKTLQQKFTKDKTTLDNTHAQESQAIEREYLLEKNQLEREFSQKKRSLEINIYV